MSPTATLISKDKIFEIQIEIGTIAMELNKISRIQIGMHTMMLNEIVKGKIIETQIEIGTIPSLLNEIVKGKIFETQIEIGTIPSLLNEIFKGKIFETQI